MKGLASLNIAIATVYAIVFSANNKEIIKDLRYLSFVGEYIGHKHGVTWRAFQCHDTNVKLSSD